MMRATGTLAIALLMGTAIAASAVAPWLAHAQSTDPADDDDDESDDDGDDDSEVPDPDDESSDPTDEPSEDPGDEPTDDPAEDPVDDPVDEPAGDPGTGGDPDDDGAGPGDDDGDSDGGTPGGDDGGDDDGPAPGGGGDDDGPAPGGGGSSDDDDDDDDAGSGGGAPPGGDDDDDDAAPPPGGGAADDDDDDAPAPPAGGGGAGDDDDDDAPAPPAGGGAGAGNDDDDDESAPAAPASATSGDDDDDDQTPDGASGGGVEFVGDEEITGGGDESEAERIALDERDGIETDREGFRYRSNEFVALDLDADDVSRLRANGFEIVSTDRLGQVGATVHLLRGPQRISDENALSLIEEMADPGSLSFNHLFDSSSGRVRRVRNPEPVERAACGCQIGLIDTGVANRLPSFRHVTIEQRAFNGTVVAPRLHGTAVAHLFAGNYARRRETTRVVVADIFSGERASAGSTYALVRALDWLASRGIPVINISLAGPRNNVVAATVQRLSARGHVIVAAAGNDGPAAPPVFPGAYQNVVAVTAVDDRQRIYRYANRGNYVDFSARGVNVPAINASGEWTAATGTSFASPVVAARLAGRLRTLDPVAARQAIAALEAEAQDLGERGRDAIYGSGFVPDAP